MLRRGNNASGKVWRHALLPAIKHYRHLDIPKFFRGDAAFANPALYHLLEKEGYHYAIRLKANAVLERVTQARVTRHAKYVTFQLAEVAVTRNLFATIPDRIARLAIPPPVVGLIRV